MQTENEWARMSRKDSETVFKGKTRPLTKDRLIFLTKLIMIDQAGHQCEPTEDAPMPFLSQIAKLRVEAFKLPISFTTNGYLTISALAHNPGAAVIVVIDAVTKFEGRKEPIGPADLCELYPNGFYDDETMCDYVDNYLKPRKVKWAEVYVSR